MGNAVILGSLLTSVAAISIMILWLAGRDRLGRRLKVGVSIAVVSCLLVGLAALFLTAPAQYCDFRGVCRS